MTDPLIFAKAMADDTRQQLMRLLCCQWLCVGDLAEQLAVTQPTVSHHLAILREAGLVEARRDGKQTYYILNQQEVAICCGLLMQRFAPEELIAPQSIEVSAEPGPLPAQNQPTRPAPESWQVWNNK